jgi:hypothetical protein
MVPDEPWRAALDRIPTVFGRLVYLRSLGGAADQAIGRAARRVFSQWLAMGLPEQARDLRAYRNGSGAAAVDHRDLVPPGAQEVERQLFLTDMETLAGQIELEEDRQASML